MDHPQRACPEPPEATARTAPQRHGAPGSGFNLRFAPVSRLRIISFGGVKIETITIPATLFPSEEGRNHYLLAVPGLPDEYQLYDYRYDGEMLEVDVEIAAKRQVLKTPLDDPPGAIEALTLAPFRELETS